MSNFLKIFLLFFFSVNILFAESVTIQSTTSTRDSGLYKYLLPYYPNFRNVEIKVIAVGTGQAIMNAQNCDGNILIVHDEKREDIFMANNYGSERHNLMYNDFVIIGPNEDSARVYGSSSVLEAFSKIYENKRIFISRSDSSGTHAAEIKIWSQLGINPAKYSGKWYLESGQGMGPSLNIAISLNGYIFSDRSSWLRFNNKESHQILYSNYKELKNTYSMILVNHERCSNLDYNLSRDLYDWLKSDAAASLIRDYKINKQSVFYID